MLRPSFIAAFALAAIVTLPTLASADECACLPAEMTVLTTTRFVQSVEVGPLFSSDGATLSSGEIVVPSIELRLLLRGGDEALICVSPDDPRCSPRDSAPDHGPQMADGAHYASSHARTAKTGPSSSSSSVLSSAIDGARSGARDRLDRPPRD